MEIEELKRTLDFHLRLDPAAEIEKICAFILREVKRRSVRGVLIGLSGGLDSTTCAYLCARCLPAAQIRLVSLPERDSSATIQENARSVAQALNLPLEERELSEFLDRLGLYAQVPQGLAADRLQIERAIRILRVLSGREVFFSWAQEYAFGRRRGLLAWLMRRKLWPYIGSAEAFIFGKVRARMLLLSLIAAQEDRLLLCTTDRSEYSIGFYDPHGDGVGDLAPLRHLYKTQIRVVAQALGVPDGIISQPSSGDLAAGLPNESAIGLSYVRLDRLLVGLSSGLGDQAIAAAVGVRRSSVRSVRAACSLAEARRRMPVSL